MLKKLIKLNLDDLWLYVAVEGGLFLLLEGVICVIVYRSKPIDAPMVTGGVMPILAGFLALISGISHVGVSFDQALRFGQTRRRALGLTLGLMSFEAAFGMVLGAVLTALERFVIPSLWAALAGWDGWVVGRSGAVAPAPIDGGPVVRYYESMSGELFPLPDNTMVADFFPLDWYWWLLAFVIGLGGGLIIGALIQRFGQKGAWVIWGVCVAPMILSQVLPWETYEITNWLFPLLAILFAAGVLWSIWSMLHAVVRT